MNRMGVPCSNALVTTNNMDIDEMLMTNPLSQKYAIPATNTRTLSIQRFSSHSANVRFPTGSAGADSSSKIAGSGSRTSAGSIRWIAMASSTSTAIAESQL